jgi:hypothetical protein
MLSRTSRRRGHRFHMPVGRRRRQNRFARTVIDVYTALWLVRRLVRHGFRTVR